MKKQLTALLLAVLLLCNISVFATEEGELAGAKFDYVVGVTDLLYYEEPEFESLFSDTIKSYLEEHPDALGDILTIMLGKLDENSDYLNEIQNDNLDLLETGEIYGIGITVGEKGKGLLVDSVLPDGPAERAGIRAEDMIMTVDGKSLEALSQNECIALIRGERGTEVTVEILRENEPELLSFTLIRAPVHANVVVSQMVNDTIGYVRIASFTAGVSDDVADQVSTLKEKGAKKLIIDLRENRGGMSDEAIRVANAFLPKGATIMTETYRDPEMNKKYQADGTGEIWPMVLLVNENTASASEILCGALKENKVATVVGRRTYGKASMQARFMLSKTESVKITIGHYLIPGDIDIHGQGIDPDENIRNRTRKVDMETDFPALSITRRLYVGDEGEDVRVVEQYLKAMGYGTGEVDGKFDTHTEQAVWCFQREHDLFPYGVADFTTQLNLCSELEKREVLEDRQFDRAVEILMGTDL